MNNVLDCNHVVSEVEFQSHDYIYSNRLREGMNSFITPDDGLNNPLLLFYNDGFGIK